MKLKHYFLTGLLFLFYSGETLARSWSCSASIHLLDSGASYSTSWDMETGDEHAAWGDRERSCKNYIEAEILNGSIWSKLNLTIEEQSAVCKSGSGAFRVDYGFDERGKNWNYNSSEASPGCDCESICPDGWWVDGGGRCATGVCGASHLSNAEFLDDGSGLYIWNGNIYQAQKAEVGNCQFR